MRRVEWQWWCDRRVITLLLAIPACYLAYSLGVALGPNHQGASQKSPPHIQSINRLTVWS